MDRFASTPSIKAPALGSAPKAIVIVSKMLSEQAGLWEITQERIALLKGYRNRLPDRHQVVVDEMLEAKGKLWPCRAEYMAALREISLINQRPGENDLRSIVEAIRDGAHTDGVYQSTWVRDAIAFLERMIEHEAIAAQAPELDNPESMF